MTGWYRRRLDDACDNFGMWPGSYFVLGHVVVFAVPCLVLALLLAAADLVEVDALRAATLAGLVGAALAGVVLSTAGIRRLWRQWAASGYARRPARATDREGHQLPAWWGPMIRHIPLAGWLSLVGGAILIVWTVDQLLQHWVPGWFGPHAPQSKGLSSGELVACLVGGMITAAAWGWTWGLALQRRGLLPPEPGGEGRVTRSGGRRGRTTRGRRRGRAARSG